jgi:hypothetical protein
LQRQLGIAGSAGCALPGHDGIAMVLPWRDSDTLQYACDCLGSLRELLCPRCYGHRLQHDYSHWCHKPPLWFWPLGDAYHAIWTGRVLGFRDRLPRGLRFAWWLLLEHDAGLREPVPVELPVRDEANELERRTAELAALMFGLHRREGLTEPIPFSVTLVADRLRVTRPRACEAIKALRQAGTIIRDGAIRGQGRPTFLYRPCEAQR